jgi:hypothetical protein
MRGTLALEPPVSACPDTSLTTVSLTTTGRPTSTLRLFKPRATLRSRDACIDEFFNLVATEILTLFEHLLFGFLAEFDVFAPGEPVPTDLWG